MKSKHTKESRRFATFAKGVIDETASFDLTRDAIETIDKQRAELAALNEENKSLAEALKVASRQLAYLQAAVKSSLGNAALRDHQLVYCDTVEALAKHEARVKGESIENGDRDTLPGYVDE